MRQNIQEEIDRLKTPKLISLILSIVMLASIFTGCNTKNHANLNPKKESPKTDNSKEVTLSWYVVGNGQPKDMQEVENEADKITEKKINAKVKITVIDSDSYQKKIQEMINSKEDFDICHVSSSLVPYKQYASNNAFAQITDDMLNKYALDAKNKLGSNFIKAASINGKLYGMPCNNEKAHALGLLFRKDLVEKYHLDTSSVKTLADAEPLLQKIKDSEPNVYPLEAVNDINFEQVLDWDYVSHENIAGAVKNSDESLKVVNQYQDEQSIDIYKLIHKYYTQGFIKKDAATVTDCKADEKAGKIFAMLKSLSPSEEAYENLSTNYEWIPVYLTKPKMSNSDATDSLEAISSTSKNKERALQFLNLLYSDKELKNLYMYGIKDKHYTVNSDGRITITEPLKNDFNYRNGLTFGDESLNLIQSSESLDKWNDINKFNSEAEVSQTLGFYFDESNVKNQMTALKTISNQYLPVLETGSDDPDTLLPKFENAMKLAGLDDVMKEEQKQLSAWKKKN